MRKTPAKFRRRFWGLDIKAAGRSRRAGIKPSRWIGPHLRLELKPGNELAVARLSSSTVQSSEAAETGRVVCISGISSCRDRGKGIRRRGRRQEQAVEDIKEFGPELKRILLFYPEGSCQARILHRLPLPAEVVQERSGAAPLPRAVVTPCLRIQNLGGLRIEASAVRVFVKQRLSRHIILEVV